MQPVLANWMAFVGWGSGHSVRWILHGSQHHVILPAVEPESTARAPTQWSQTVTRMRFWLRVGPVGSCPLFGPQWTYQLPYQLPASLPARQAGCPIAWQWVRFVCFQSNLDRLGSCFLPSGIRRNERLGDSGQGLESIEWAHGWQWVVLPKGHAGASVRQEHLSLLLS